eukprot:NODE_10315_length_1360_cov_19.328467.p3 GENE.NODE_10315_length_1360_cov_19.328467~~NODE_10315_length_1360_cov_19.328467.p3  ORF type:complete len:140 (-),score=19.28 NODE_10315_length_1360_cov_19.328467:161-580(-)
MRRSFAASCELWQKLHIAPFAHPPGLMKLRQGRHWPLAWFFEPRDGCTSAWGVMSVTALLVFLDAPSWTPFIHRFLVALMACQLIGIACWVLGGVLGDDVSDDCDVAVDGVHVVRAGDVECVNATAKSSSDSLPSLESL